MKAQGEEALLERLRLTLGERLGFAFDGDRLEQLEHAARARQNTLGLPDLSAYLERLAAAGTSREEVALLAEALTVTETFFYRSAEQIDALVEAVLPERAQRGASRLRILSAGCASGEEPYSLAIALLEALPAADAANVQITAIDVNRAMLAKAARGRYTPWSLRSTPDAIRARYFKAAGRDLVLDERVRKMVTFREQNLATDDPTFFQGLGCDTIFCRNVIMYFTPAVMKRVLGRLTAALLPGGFLFLGHAETLRGLSHDYHLCHTHGTFYYQRREGDEPKRSAWNERTSEPRAELEALPAVVDGTTSWFDAIQRASHRVTELTNGAHTSQAIRARKGTKTGDPRVEARSELAPVLELMQRERFAEARALLDSLPNFTSDQPDALLFSAVLFTNGGRIAEAERACEKLLEADELNAGAHYLKALCREHAGDALGAAEHDQFAVHLDPSFAMPHLHAGLLAKRAGDAVGSRRELGLALTLLEREETSRLVLFGGGFSREALTTLCRTELVKLGGST